MKDTLSKLLANTGSSAEETMKQRATESLRGELEEILQEALEDAIQEAIAESRTESVSSESTGRRRGPGALLWLGAGVAIGYLLADREVELSPETYDEASEQLRTLSGEASERIEPYAGDRSEQVERITEDIAGELDDRAAEQRTEQRSVPSVGQRGPLALLALGSIGVAGYLLLNGRSGGPDWQEEAEDWESSATDVAVGSDSVPDSIGEEAHDGTEEEADDAVGEDDDSAGEEVESDGTAL
jgi:hypothetical protein